jgi:hypothetical protein
MSIRVVLRARAPWTSREQVRLLGDSRNRLDDLPDLLGCLRQLADRAGHVLARGPNGAHRLVGLLGRLDRACDLLRDTVSIRPRSFSVASL